MLASFATFNGLAPEGGPKAILWQIDLTAVNTVNLDLAQEEFGKDFGGVQGAYVDNSAGATALTIFIPVTQQNIVIPAKTQGFYSILSNGVFQARLTGTVAAGYKPTVHLLNVPVSNHSWTTP